jgi:hypothetical protein
MASKLFRQLAQQSQETKVLDKILSGGTWLTEGTHEVTITAVDSTEVGEERGKVKITYESGGKTKDDNLFLFNREGTDWSISARKFWAAIIPSTVALAKFMATFEKDEQAFELFTGMKAQITLKYGKGFRVSSRDGVYVCIDETGTQVGDPAEDIKTAQENGEAAGGKRAYLNVYDMKATNAEENIAILDKAIAAKAKATMSVFSVGKSI